MRAALIANYPSLPEFPIPWTWKFPQFPPPVVRATVAGYCANGVGGVDGETTTRGRETLFRSISKKATRRATGLSRLFGFAPRRRAHFDGETHDLAIPDMSPFLGKGRRQAAAPAWFHFPKNVADFSGCPGNGIPIQAYKPSRPHLRPWDSIARFIAGF